MILLSENPHKRLPMRVLLSLRARYGTATPGSANLDALIENVLVPYCSPVCALRA